jgi:hypothetical protein
VRVCTEAEDAMAWRKWFVRGVVFIVAGCCAAGGYIYQQWTNPAAVREQVLRNLKVLFEGADVAVDTARLTLMGRIQVGQTRLARRDDPDQIDAIQIPSSYLYHDKEKLLEGELSLRKVELFRPRFRVYRNKDGKWNLEGLLSPPRLDKRIPTIVIHQGTLLLEDRTISGNITSLEITDFNMTAINDPLLTLSFEGVAQAPLVGKVTIVGSLQRDTNELTLEIKTKDTPLSSKLLQRLAPFCPQNSLKDLDLNGQADMEINLHSQPGRTPSLHYDVSCHVRRTRLTHALLPLPLEELEAKFRLVDGALTVEQAVARSGGARIKARGAATVPCPDQNFEAFVDIDGLSISADVLKRLPEKSQDVIRLFDPKGSVGVRVAVMKRDGVWARFDDGRESSVTILPERVSSVFQKFPYPLTDVVGTLDYQLSSKKLKFFFDAKAEGQPVKIRGSSVGGGLDLDLTAEIHAIDIPINETALKSLPPGPEKIARSFHAKGKFDVVAAIRHKPGMLPFENTFHVAFRECAVEWEPFPLPLQNVSGLLDISPAGWEFHDFRGRHGDGLFQIKGRSFPVAGKEQPGVFVEIVGAKVALSPTLHRALDPMPGLKSVWTTFAPSGAMNFSATINRPTSLLEDLEVHVQAQGATVEPKFFKYRMTDVAGIVHFHNQRVELTKFSGQHGDALFVVPKANIDLKPGGGYHVEVPDLDIQNLRADAQFVKALPETLASACETMQLQDPLRIKTRVVVAQTGEPDSRPDIYWNAQAWLKDARFVAGVPVEEVSGVVGCRGRHDGRKILGVEGNVLLDKATMFKQPLRNVHAHFRVDENAPDVLLAGISAPQFGGDITGEIRIDFQQATRFELNLTASQIDLQKFGQQNMGASSQMEGRAVGRLHLTGTSAGVKSLEGNGSFDVFAGKLYNLPLILDLLKFLGLRWPDRTAFEEVHALFRIQGPKVTLRKLELQGNAISLSGQGDFNFDGTDMHIDFYPTWARIEQLLPPALRTVPPAVSKNFLIIEVRGKVTANNDDLKFTKRPMPIVMDPLLNIRDRVIGPADPRRSEPLSQRPVLPLDREK